jgi:hypothetical protein
MTLSRSCRSSWPYLLSTVRSVSCAARASGGGEMFSYCCSMAAKLIEAYDKMTPEQQRKATDACRHFRLMVSGSAALPGAPYPEPSIPQTRALLGVAHDRHHHNLSRFHRHHHREHHGSVAGDQRPPTARAVRYDRVRDGHLEPASRPAAAWMRRLASPRL